MRRREEERNIDMYLQLKVMEKFWDFFHLSCREGHAVISTADVLIYPSMDRREYIKSIF